MVRSLAAKLGVMEKEDGGPKNVVIDFSGVYMPVPREGVWKSAFPGSHIVMSVPCVD